MKTKINKDMAVIRKKWLDKHGLTIRKIANAIEIDYNSVSRWISYGREPRYLYLRVMLKSFPDFPTESSLRRTDAGLKIRRGISIGV